MAMPAWVSEVGVTATVIVASLAIWGERIRATFLKPKLRLRLRNDFGELTEQRLTDQFGNVVGVQPARYYHLRVTNETHFPAAHEVLVFLTKVERPGPNGEAQTLYETDLPLSWMHPQLYKDPHRTIGNSTVAISDLFFVSPNRLRLLPVMTPNNLPDTFQPDAHFWVTLVARGIDGESNYLRLKVDWDGAWHSGETEMRQHLVISIA
jgi:hypothetical protein